MPKKSTKSKKKEVKPVEKTKKISAGIGSIIIAVIITAIVAGGAVYLLLKPGMEEQSDELKIVTTGKQSQIENLQSQIAQLNKDKEVMANILALQPTQKLPTGWDEQFPATGDSTLKKSSTLKMKTTLGEPSVLIRQDDKEVWVYMPYEQDPTGLYLFFLDGKLIKHRLDEFNGLSHALIDTEENWTE